VANFEAFSEDNDPHGEHDFGAVMVDGKRVFFKVDYYDRSKEWLSEDPADPEKTCRVMTILLAEEY
jgi:major membrane immunogen (membrane-anchored lipoprotein)